MSFEVVAPFTVSGLEMFPFERAIFKFNCINLLLIMLMVLDFKY
jgi:hypothetical protein